jgi:hypothetical protein
VQLEKAKIAGLLFTDHPCPCHTLMDCVLRGVFSCLTSSKFEIAEYAQVQGLFWLEDRTKSSKGLRSGLLISPLFHWVSERLICQWISRNIVESVLNRVLNWFEESRV